MFICIQKINIISNLFLGYCKDIASLLFWELWERLTIPIKNDSINLQETFMLICTQQINVITHFFIKILQRNSKLVILGNLGTPRPPKKLASTWRNLWCLSARKKNQLHSFFFPWHIAKILQICCSGNFGQSTAYSGCFGLLTYTQNDTSTLQKAFVFNCRPKSNFILHVFLEVLQRYANFLFWVLCACLTAHTQNDKINL